jgi:hypothetical protein
VGAMSELPLPDGGLAPVSRVGQTVRRQTGPWTPAVHALLRHLEAVGFDGAPRVLGIDDKGREVLTYVDGEDGHHARRAALHDDRTLAAVGRLIKRYHAAVADFVPPSDAQWRNGGDSPAGSIVCHNDLGPVNTVYADGRPRAFIDWDFAAPGLPVWDLAYAAWSFVPLFDNEFCLRAGYPSAPRGPRLRILCDAYGLHDRDGFVDVVRSRQQTQYDMVRNAASAGDPQYERIWRDNAGQRWLDAMRYLDSEHDEWVRHLL